MKTNVSDIGYYQMEKLSEEIENQGVEQKTPTSGLLSPTINRRKKDSNAKLEDSPAYRVATYFKTIRDKRMDINRA